MEDLKVTEGGIAYKVIEVPDFDSVESMPQNQKEVDELPKKRIRIRVSIKPQRLKDDDETYEEYRYRQSMINHKINKYLKNGTLIWNSSMLKTYDKKLVESIIEKQNRDESNG